MLVGQGLTDVLCFSLLVGQGLTDLLGFSLCVVEGVSSLPNGAVESRKLRGMPEGGGYAKNLRASCSVCRAHLLILVRFPNYFRAIPPVVLS